MKIMHLMLACFYIDNYSYQENLLPKYHKKLGYDVEIIASLFTFDENGEGKWFPKAMKYINEDNIPVTRLEFKKGKLAKYLRRYVGLMDELERFSPDILFIHGLQFFDITLVVKYLKNHPNVKVFVDNHADFYNSAKNWFSRWILHKSIWRWCAKLINPYTKKFFGVLPARVDFLVNVYKIPTEKVELLIMGADDEAVKSAATIESKEFIRKKHKISSDDFLIVYGGKTDNNKKQVLLLMDAINAINNPKVKLIIFGSVIPEMKMEINKRCSDKVQYIGWILAEDSYKYFAAADLACFPGKHSVFWEQAAGQGIPLLIKYWEGITHLDFRGNVEYLRQDSIKEIKEKIEYILQGNRYERMLNIAKQVSKYFLYSEIAKRSISC